MGIASTLNGNLIVGARAFHGNPYAGHTLSEQLEQATILMQDSQLKLTTAFVDLGYRGVDAHSPDVRIVHRGKSKRISAQETRQLPRRQAIEPISATSRTITAWSAATSRVSMVTGCMRCCVRRATTSNGCYA